MVTARSRASSSRQAGDPPDADTVHVGYALAAKVKLPDSWDPERHQGSDKEGQGESIASRVWSTLKAHPDRFVKIGTGLYRLKITEKGQPQQFGKVPAKKGAAKKAKKVRASVRG